MINNVYVNEISYAVLDCHVVNATTELPQLESPATSITVSGTMFASIAVAIDLIGPSPLTQVQVGCSRTFHNGSIPAHPRTTFPPQWVVSSECIMMPEVLKAFQTCNALTVTRASRTVLPGCDDLGTSAECLDGEGCGWCAELGYCAAEEGDREQVNCSNTCSSLSPPACTVSSLSRFPPPCGWCAASQLCAPVVGGATQCPVCTRHLNESSCRSVAFCTWCPMLGYCEIASAGCDLYCNEVAHRETCDATSYCSWCELTASCNDGKTSCNVCLHLDNTACIHLSTACTWCGNMSYCGAIQNISDNSGLQCMQYCGEAADEAQCEIMSAECTWCGDRCAPTSSQCDCFLLNDTRNCKAPSCALCPGIDGSSFYCNAQASCLCSTASSARECAVANTAGGLCHWDFAHEFCTSGACFSFLQHGYSPYPYFLFLVGLLKDFAVLVLSGVIAPLLRRARTYARCAVHSAVGQASDERLRDLNNHRRVKTIYIDRPVTAVFPLTDGARLDVYEYVERVVESCFEISDSLSIEQRQLFVEQLQVQVLTSDLWIDIETTLQRRSSKLRLIDAATRANTFLPAHATHRVVKLPSASWAGTVAASVVEYPSPGQLALYLLSSLLGTVSAIHDLSVHLSDTHQSGFGSFDFFLLVGFRFINSSFVGTVALISIKYAAAVARSREGKYQSKGSACERATQLRLQHTWPVHFATWLYLLVPLPFVVVFVVPGAALYGWFTLAVVSMVVAVRRSVRLAQEWSTNSRQNPTSVEAADDDLIPMAGIDKKDGPEIGGILASLRRTTRKLPHQHSLQAEDLVERSVDDTGELDDEKYASPSIGASLREFFLVQELPTLATAALIQAAFNYFVFFLHRDAFAHDTGYLDVIKIDWDSRSANCMISKIREELNKTEQNREISSFLQLFSSVIPFC